jgi:predicted ABC-type ATPase
MRNHRITPADHIHEDTLWAATTNILPITLLFDNFLIMTSRRKPNLYIIAGPNGAGKTTFAREFLPYYVECLEFVNADLIAGGLSPFVPERAAIQAGRIVLEQIHVLGYQRRNFGFESTLSGKAYIKLLRDLKRDGYVVHIFYLWLQSVELAVKRIEDRVRNGGRSVPEEIVRRRFGKSLFNFMNLYRPLADTWHLFDNSTERPKTIAEFDGKLNILDFQLYEHLSLHGG